MSVLVPTPSVEIAIPIPKLVSMTFAKNPIGRRALPILSLKENVAFTHLIKLPKAFSSSSELTPAF